MSKKKQRQPTRPAASKPVKPSPGGAPPPAAEAKPTRTESVSSRPALLMYVGSGLLVVAIGLVALWLIRGAQVPAAPTATPTAAAAVANRPIGGVTNCKVQAKFTEKLGFSRRGVLQTNNRTVKGLVLYEPDAQGQPTKNYQHPTWTMGGSLGPPVIDDQGNIYLVPVPNINMLDNPPDKSNTIYKVDTNTGVMSPWVVLPPGAPDTGENPFGLLGLTYDCDTKSLYAASVLGSTPTEEHGRIYHVDAATGKILGQLEAFDAFGVAVFNGSKGKRLYYGHARSSEVRSIALDDKGGFVGEPRLEMSVENQGVHGDEKIRRITFDTNDTMVLRSMQFDFNLVASTEVRQTGFNYSYDAAADAWKLVGTFPIN